LSKRKNGAFGSARNPKDNSITFDEDVYVQLPIVQVDRSVQCDVKDRSYIVKPTPIDLKVMESELLDGKIYVLLAPFGAGKSLTAREIFEDLTKCYYSGSSTLIPIAINLREHWGQDYFDEVLERHARSIGFTPKEDLVVAWRAGLACILLDGFDEVASQTVVRRDDKNFMKDARYKALTGVRAFMTKLPMDMGVFLCGRDHYFDSENEMIHALGLTGKSYKQVRLDEFTENSANEFLKRNGVQHFLPDWVPRKPLILGYLVNNNLIDEILAINSSEGFGYAWDRFLDRICERESTLERAVMDPQAVRSVMERLAHKVRATVSGTGPITGNDLSHAFEVETGQAAGEGVLAQLQRLPGLTQREQDPGARSFIDEDMLAALQGGALANLILGKYKNLEGSPLSCLNYKAISVSSYILIKNSVNCSTVISVIERLWRQGYGQEYSVDKVNTQLIADCVEVAINLAISSEVEEIDFRGISLESAHIGTLNLEDIKVQNVQIRDCLISELLIGSQSLKSGLSIVDCLIIKVSGIASENSLPPGMCTGKCEYEEFDNMSTNSAVLQLDIPASLKALITILRKLYKQAGAGRKLSALRRGITKNDVLEKVGEVLDILERFDFISIFNQIVHPVRKQASRVQKILDAPMLSDDPVILEVKKLDKLN
jgi:hypothetical protein